MSKLVKNYILTLAYELIAVIVPLFTAPYLTRTLHASNFGIYSVVYSALSLIQSISLMGLYTYGSRQTAYVREDKTALSSLFRELMILRISCGIVGTFVFFTYGHAIGYGIYFAGFYAYYLANVFDVGWVFAGNENMLPCVAKNIIAKLITLAGTFLFVKNEGDVLIYILVVSLPMLIANISIMPFLNKYIGKGKPKIANVPRHLIASFSLCLPYIVSQIYLQVDKIMIERLADSTSQVSYYDQAEKIVLIPLSIITSLSAVIMPRIANEYIKDGKREIEKHLVLVGKYSVCISFPMMFGMIALSKYFIPWYLGSEYYMSSAIIMILSPMIVFNSLSGISGQQYFMATNQIGVMLRSSIIAAVSNVILNALLIPPMGCVGAAIATLAANLIVVIVQYVEMCKQIRFTEVFTAGTRYLVYSVIMFFAIRLITNALSLEATAFTTIVQIIIGIIVYAIILIIARDELVQYICGFLIKKKKTKSGG